MATSLLTPVLPSLPLISNSISTSLKNSITFPIPTSLPKYIHGVGRTRSKRIRSRFNHGGYLTYNVASYTKSELVELRKRLASELEQIQNLRDQIKSSQFNVNSSSNNSRSQGKAKKLSGNKRPRAPVGCSKDPKID
ncbi:transcription factor GTE7-like [Forsythia ovata]|uniref:Transcription factor GTE7-like n=1 Tax=Forsythia ovata TaxID=205694 RepID=A0ABD1RZ13_9LAMI